MQLAELTPRVFLMHLHRTKHQLKEPLGHSLTVYSEEEMAGARCFYASKERAGYAVQPDGELVNVFSIAQGQGDYLVQHALAHGAVHLNCYAGYLEDLYRRNGFVEYNRVAWDDQYIPKGWDKRRWGTPDVIFMRVGEE